MVKNSKQPNPFTGRWRIVSMEQSELNFVDEEEEGYIEFDDKDRGSFHFGYVHGNMDCQLTTRDGLPAVEWSWDGNDEMNAAQGRGWAVIKNDELDGMIFFRGADSSGFVAKKKGQLPPTSKKEGR